MGEFIFKWTRESLSRMAGWFKEDGVVEIPGYNPMSISPSPSVIELLIFSGTLGHQNVSTFSHGVNF